MKYFVTVSVEVPEASTDAAGDAVDVAYHMVDSSRAFARTHGAKLALECVLIEEGWDALRRGERPERTG